MIPKGEPKGPVSAFESPTFGQDASFDLDKPVGSASISPCGRDVVLASYVFGEPSLCFVDDQSSNFWIGVKGFISLTLTRPFHLHGIYRITHHGRSPTFSGLPLRLETIGLSAPQTKKVSCGI